MTPWKVRTNDFYSRVAINHKKKTSERSEQKSFWMNRVFHDMKFLFHSYLDFFLTEQKISKIGSKRLLNEECEKDDFIELLTFEL